MPNIRNIIIFLGLAAVFTAVYIYFIKSGPEQNLSIVSSSVNSATQNSASSTSSDTQNVIAKNFLSLLLNTKNIKLEDSIFSDKSFQSLIDSSIPLVPEVNAGRPNPFAQFGADSSAVPATTTPATTTPKEPLTPGTVTP